MTSDSPNPPRLNLSILPYDLAIVRFAPEEPVPDRINLSPFLSITRTSDELSIVCEQSLIPPGVRCESGWQALKVAGPLDFSLTGILASLATPLAQAGLSVFVISTFDTDYLLVKQANLEKSVSVLRSAGHKVDAA